MAWLGPAIHDFAFGIAVKSWTPGPEVRHDEPVSMVLEAVQARVR
jgi:hypothetical protein